MSIQLRIFMGIIQNKEVKLHLNQSNTWKEAKFEESELSTVQWKDKEYLGIFIPSQLNFSQLKEKEAFIKVKLHFFCPKLKLDEHSVFLFSQVFLN